MRRELTYAGKPLSEFGVWVDNSKIYRKPMKRYTGYDIPARNGTLYQSDKKYDNVTMEFNCYIKKDFDTNFSNLVNYLNSFDTYQKLENSHNPNMFRLALFHEAVEVETGQFLKDGQFRLYFDCKPQEFFKIGDEFIDIGTGIVLNNPSYQKSKPVFKVKVPSKVSINGEQVIDAFGMIDWAETPSMSGDISYQVHYGYIHVQGQQSTDFERYIAYLTVPVGTYTIKLEGHDYRSLVKLRIGDNYVNINEGYTFTVTEKTTFTLSVFIQSYTQVDDDFTLSLEGQSEYMFIDSELMDAYYEDGTNANPYVELSEGFIELPKGDSTIAVEGEAEIKPKWWRL